MIIRHALTAIAVLIPSIAFSQMPGDTFGGSGGSVTGTGRVDAVAGDQAGQDISSTGTVNVVIDLIPTAVSAGQCTNCDLTVDTNGRITQKSDGTGGSGATTNTSNVLHATSGVGVTALGIGGINNTPGSVDQAEIYLAPGGDLYLNKAGAGIITTPSLAAGEALTLEELGNANGNTFTLELGTSDLTNDVTCTIEADGALDASCPLIDNLVGGAANIDSLTDVDTTTAAPGAGEVLSWNASSNLWVPAAAGVGAININAVTDVDTTTAAPVAGEVLTWDASSNLWEPAALTSTSKFTVGYDFFASYGAAGGNDCVASTWGSSGFSLGLQQGPWDVDNTATYVGDLGNCIGSGYGKIGYGTWWPGSQGIPQDGPQITIYDLATDTNHVLAYIPAMNNLNRPTTPPNPADFYPITSLANPQVGKRIFANPITYTWPTAFGVDPANIVLTNPSTHDVTFSITATLITNGPFWPYTGRISAPVANVVNTCVFDLFVVESANDATWTTLGTIGTSNPTTITTTYTVPANTTDKYPITVYYTRTNGLGSNGPDSLCTWYINNGGLGNGFDDWRGGYSGDPVNMGSIATENLNYVEIQVELVP